MPHVQHTEMNTSSIFWKDVVEVGMCVSEEKYARAKTKENTESLFRNFTAQILDLQGFHLLNSFLPE